VKKSGKIKLKLGKMIVNYFLEKNNMWQTEITIMSLVELKATTLLQVVVLRPITYPAFNYSQHSQKQIY
jgi:hypothetical protein